MSLLHDGRGVRALSIWLPSRQKVMLPFSQPGELMPMARRIHFVVKRRIGTSTFMRRDLVYALMIEAIRVGHGL